MVVIGLVIRFKRRYKIFIIILAFLMAGLGVLGKNGLITLLRLKEQYLELTYENDSIKRSNQSLSREIYLLKKDRDYIEKIAREELGMVKRDEIILRFEK